jgi:DMSO/TMAO reductase YedYZ heme-binding membrane subunit
MSLIIALALAVIFTLVCNRALRRVPLAFYLLALAISVAGVYLTWNPNPNALLRAFAFAEQKGHIGFAFFVVVMFIGVLSPESPLRRRLNPVRAELSIFAALLILGHLVPYLLSYLALALGIFDMRAGIVISLLTALFMLLLLIVLTATSFNMVKARMKASHWKAIQRFSYLFFVLVFIHLAGYLIIPILRGSGYALLNMTIYLLVLISYLTLRLRRARIDRRANTALPVNLDVTSNEVKVSS